MLDCASTVSHLTLQSVSLLVAACNLIDVMCRLRDGGQSNYSSILSKVYKILIFCIQSQIYPAAHPNS